MLSRCPVCNSSFGSVEAIGPEVSSTKQAGILIPNVTLGPKSLKALQDRLTFAHLRRALLLHLVAYDFTKPRCLPAVYVKEWRTGVLESPCLCSDTATGELLGWEGSKQSMWGCGGSQAGVWQVGASPFAQSGEQTATAGRRSCRAGAGLCFIYSGESLKKWIHSIVLVGKDL